MIIVYTFMENGQIKRGNINAETAKEAEVKLRRMGIVPITVQEPNGPHLQASTLTPVNDPIQETMVMPPPLPPHINEELPLPDFMPKNVIKPNPNQSFPLPPIKKTRRQSFLYGEEKSIRGLIENYLSKNGIITHISVHPDLQGKMILVMVIEHDTETEGK